MHKRRTEEEPIAGFTLEHERELLKHEAESLRTFYSLTGPARKDYTEQMAEAEAQRLHNLGQGHAQALLEAFKAEAEGYRLIGEALASLPNASDVLEIARLHAMERVAERLANGKATKIFLTQGLGNIFSALGGLQEVLDGSREKIEQPVDI